MPFSYASHSGYTSKRVRFAPITDSTIQYFDSETEPNTIIKRRNYSEYIPKKSMTKTYIKKRMEMKNEVKPKKKKLKSILKKTTKVRSKSQPVLRLPAINRM